MCRFEIGDQVVYINPFKDRLQNWVNRNPDFAGNILPIDKCVYTVRGFIKYPEYESVGIYLKEIVNTPMECLGHEMAFNVKFFRPIKKTDISDLEKILNKSPELV